MARSKEKYNEYMREYRKKNAERDKEIQHNNYVKHREERLKYRREYMAKRRAMLKAQKEAEANGDSDSTADDATK